MALNAKRSRSLLLLNLLLVGNAFVQRPAMSQEAKPADEAIPAAQQLEAVIVTAQRRAENIKDVPMAITTLKGERLDVLTAGGQDIRLLAGRAPSLNVESSFGRTFPRFYIRGLGNTDFDLNASQPVGLVVDDVVQENPMLKGFPLFDVEQVEVLRGPQGTLFGRNSPAGVLKIDSVKPGNKLEAHLNAGIGNHSAVNLDGAYNIPLSSEWAMRISLLSQHRGDRVHNDRPNAPTRDFEGYDDRAARIQMQYKVRDFSALLNVHHRKYEGSATLFRANIIKPGTNELVDGFDIGSYPTDGGNIQQLDTTGAILRLSWNFDDMKLHAITGYEGADFYSRGDIDGGYGAAFAPPSGPGIIPFPAETADGMPHHKQWSQEVRLESAGAGPLQWIGGLYAFKEDITVESFNFDTLAGNKPSGYAIQHQQAKAWAVFGSLNYAATPRLKLRGGLRYTSDKKDFDASRTVDPFGGRTIGPLTAHPSATNTSWDLSATYELDKNTNLFARVATGYRAPSIQGRILFGDTISVGNSERVLSYEGGIKQDMFNRRARLSASLFQYRTKDMQLTAGSGSVNQSRLLNASKVTGQGAELDFQAILTDELRLTLGGSYIDTEIRDASLFVSKCGSGCTMLDPDGPFPGTVFINGNPLPRAPKWTANVSLRYSRPLGDGEMFAFTDWAYRSTYNYSLYEAKEYVGKALLEGGLRLGYKWGDGKYEAALFARNLTNKVQLEGAIDLNNLTGIVSEPRTVGLQFRAVY